MTGSLRPTRGRRRRAALLPALAVVLAAPLLGAPSAAAATQAPGRVTTTYENPLEPIVPRSLVPTNGTVDSCADPTVLKGQADERVNGLQAWYMYCTTDPLNDADRGPDGDDADMLGDLNFRRIPQMVSTDLVNWTYVGEALPRPATKIPAWVAPDAAFWAPDVVYSSEFDRYYLFVTVTETTGVGGVGSDTCRGDGALGVATSASPTGPWVFADAPVVAPRKDPTGGACSYFWTFDPDVLGDTVQTTGTFYYGSYYGGMFGTPITFTADGASTGDVATHTRVSIGNRYEGPNVVQRDGWYYLFASATDCCNGGLTGYSVFVGRSRSALGPFLDREGNSLNDTQVGGTPFLTMNGNRWVGTGHNTVFQDEAGQWWTIYHAVDREDPFFTTDLKPGERGFTKRPALLDPIDWVGGWPTVNGGAFASDTEMPAPAAQEGQRSRYRTKLVKPQVLGRQLVSDGFSGNRLMGDWDWVRQPAAADYSVARGVLRFKVQAKDLFVDSNNASVLLRDAPKGDYAVETRVRVNVPVQGCCFNYAQAGLVVYGDDDNFIKLSNASIWETRQTEFAKELSPVPGPGWSRYGNTVVGPPAEYPAWTYLRIAVERLRGPDRVEALGDTERYTAYTSQDGVRWVRGGVWTHSLGADARIGLISMASPGDKTFTAEFDYVRTYALRGGPRR